MRAKLLGEKRGSKRWWKIANEIMDVSGSSTVIPALKTESGWAFSPEEKADLFADTFAAKFSVPRREPNEHCVEWPHLVSSDILVVRSRGVARSLEALKSESGTGPDGLATRVLKTCARQLCFPLAKLIRRILALGFWPTAWITHWLMPLFKRKLVSDPQNYRAINLTTQVSKVVERFLNPWVTPRLERFAFGDAQFAYRKHHGARDAVLYYVLSWIGGLNVGSKIGVYASDVQGAFDKVDSELLLRKLASFNLDARILAVVRSWLRERRGLVIVNGCFSRPIRLFNMVYQGTVWGPTLWNAFFGDCTAVIRLCGFDVVVYADDQNAFKFYPRALSNIAIEDDLREGQLATHRWGAANSVTFDASKEEFMIISTTEPLGGPIKLLGIEFDNRLLMNIAAHNCAKKAAWKTKSLLRARRFYSIIDMLMLFKSHVLSFIEYRTAGIHFASTSVLKEVDEVQTRFLRELELTEESALMNFNLAPLSTRRDIAMLGVIHRAALREGPQQLWKFFRLALPASSNARNSRHRSVHSMRLEEWPAGRNLDIIRRSALGSIRVYNLLPADVVLHKTVKQFQQALSGLVKDRVVAGDSRWRNLLSPRHALFQYHPLVHPP